MTDNEVQKTPAPEEQKLFLNESDIELVRVLEDLIDLLTAKHNILFTDLPEAAQEKLLKRKNARQVMQHSIIDDGDNDIFI